MSDNFKLATTYREIVGFLIAHRRKISGLSQRSIAQKADLRGQSALTIDQLSNVADVLEITPGELLSLADSATAYIRSREIQV